MSSLTNYKGLQVVAPNPSGAGGFALNADLKALVDWNPKSKWDATSPPSASDDEGDDFQVGSLWYDASGGTLSICTDASTDSAIWLGLPIDTAFKSGARSSDLTIDSTTLVTTGLTFSVKSDETWTFEFVLFAKQLNADADLKVKVEGPAGSTGRYGLVSTESHQVRCKAIGAESDAIDATTSTDSDDQFTVNGIVTAGADGDIELFVRNDSGTDTQIFYQYSYFVARRIG